VDTGVGRFYVGHYVRGQCLVVVAVAVMMVHVVVVAAMSLRFFQFFAALLRLPASLAVSMHRIAQLFFCLVNAFFTFAVSVSIVRPHLEGRAHQSDDRQQCYATNPDHSSHIFSL
jgi:hypothetical protein